MVRWLFALLSLNGSLSAASYYVTVNGSDVAAGTEAAPWRTIQKGFNTAVEGDTIFFGPGDFAEYLTTASHGNSASTTNRIFLRPNPTNTAPAEIRQLRVSHRFHWIDGIKITRTIDLIPANQNGAHIRGEAASTGTVITNCWLSDTPLLSARFHFATNGNEFLLTITNSVGNFLTNGFVVGGHVFLGANSVSNGNETPVLKFYTNHDVAVRIKAISADGQTLTVTNNAATNFFSESVQSLWATIYAGQGNSGFPGILLPLGSGQNGATNWTVVNCTVSNLTGSAFTCWGERNLFTGNYITKLNSFYACRPFGRHNTFRRNTWRNSPNRIWHSDFEIATASHPAGGSFYDYDVGAIHTQVSGTTNVLFEQNWVEGFEQQLGAIDKQNVTDAGVYTFRSNVFIGFSKAMSQNADWCTNRNNTYYRISYDASHAMGLGGPNPSNLQTNLEVANCVFVDCGRQHDASTGWYSTTDTYQPNLTNNFACGPEATGWHAKNAVASNPLTFNGGDPVFLNPQNPIGPDGLAFTEDDGLKPLPSSILAKRGLGALTPVSVSAGVPIAHFSLASPTNWLDYIYTNYNPGWLLLEAPDRGGSVRPYTVVDPIGNVPARVKFTATNSIGGLDANSTNHAGITSYGWNFGDGYRQMVTTNGEAWHTFGRTGEVMVTLWVTNSSGGTSSCSNRYRILPFTNFVGRIWYVATNGNNTTGTGTNENLPFLTLAKAETVVEATNYVIVLPGSYTNEVLDVNRNVATTTGRITYLGFGASIGGFNVRHPYHTFDGFSVNGQGIGNFGKLFYLYETADEIWVQNCYLTDVQTNTSKMGVGMIEPAGRYPTDGQLSCIVSNNTFDGVRYVNIQLMGSNHIVIDNWIGNTGRPSGDDGDVFRPFGSNHRIARNYATNFFGGHGDFAQAFGPTFWSKDIIFEDNIAIGTTNGSGSALCQIEMDPSANYDYTNELQLTNWVLRNNQFINMALAGSVDIAGTKWYNNLFYKCNTSSGSPLVFGGPKGSSYGTEIKNNIFFGCGNGSASGWYPRTNDQPGITWNWDLVADNNYVAKADFSAYPQAPPNANTSFKSDNQDASGVNGGDPKFVNADAFNFRLQTNSPLLHAGTTITGFNVDAEGVTRPQGSAWSIGPFEGEAGDAGSGPTGTVPARIGMGRSSAFILSP